MLSFLSLGSSPHNLKHTICICKSTCKKGLLVSAGFYYQAMSDCPSSISSKTWLDSLASLLLPFRHLETQSYFFTLLILSILVVASPKDVIPQTHPLLQQITCTYFSIIKFTNENPQKLPIKSATVYFLSNKIDSPQNWHNHSDAIVLENHDTRMTIEENYIWLEEAG